MATQKLEIIVEGKDRASKVLGGISGLIGGLGKAAAGIAVGGLAAIGVGLAAGAFSGLKFNVSLENVTAQLNAFTKDGAKSAEILEMIKDRAARTPFAFDEMARAAAGLLPASKQANESLESIIGTAEILAASNPAQGLEGAAFAIREAVSGDFTSAIERFNLPRDMIKKLKEEGVPNLEILRGAMTAMGYDTDLVSNLAETASGRWSTFLDSLTNVAAIVTKPLFDGLSSGLGTLQGKIDENMPRIEAIATLLGEKLGAALSWLTDTALPAVVGAFEVAWPIVQAAVETAYLFFKETIWPWLMVGFGWIKETALPAVQSAFEATWPIIQQSVETAYLFFREVIWPWLEQNFALLQDTVLPSLQKAFDEVWPKIQAAVAAVYDWLSNTFFPWIRDTAIPWIRDVGLPALKIAFETVWPLIEAAVRTVYVFFRDTVWPWISEAFRKTKDEELPALKKAFEVAWPIIKEAVMTAYTWFKDIAWPWLSENFTNLRTWLSEVETRFNDAWPKIQSAVTTAYTFFKDTVWPWLSGAFSDVKTWVGEVETRWDGAWSAIGSAVTTAKNTISGAISTIKRLVDEAIGKINGLITLINNIPGVDIPSIPTAPSGGSSGFGGARAMGGPVSRGLAYIVGERGPELFVPGQSGTIVANDNLAGKTVINNYNVVGQYKLQQPRTIRDELRLLVMATPSLSS